MVLSAITSGGRSSPPRPGDFAPMDAFSPSKEETANEPAGSDRMVHCVPRRAEGNPLTVRPRNYSRPASGQRGRASKGSSP